MIINTHNGFGDICMKKDTKQHSEFERPKLPIAWLASTFIAPILVIVVPSLLSASASMATLVIIALSLLSALLFCLCIIVILRLYDEAFERQIMEFRLSRAEEEALRAHERLDKLTSSEGTQEQ
jgi:hypothetical protein